MIRPIVLVGAPGAGKSTVGAALATRLGCNFFDSDEEIERRFGTTIMKHFRDHGEASFRALERCAVADLLRRKRCIVALGGGALNNRWTRIDVKERCSCVWLDPPVEIMAKRLEHCSNRPLLEGKDRTAALCDLLDKRRPYYREADFRIQAVDLETILQEISSALRINSAS